MLLRHATIAKNLPRILRAGLLCSKSEGKLAVVWLHTAGKTAWATVHTIRRHGGRIEAVVTPEVGVPRSWLRRSRAGLWYCLRDIPAERIRRLLTFGEVSRSPVEEVAPAA
jgi:hypothetical protein